MLLKYWVKWKLENIIWTYWLEDHWSQKKELWVEKSVDRMECSKEWENDKEIS